MVDITKSKEVFNMYNGSEKKKTIILDEKKYLVKFPDPIREKNKEMSYINNAFSEYIGSNIFKIIGMEVQNTMLATYNYNGKDKIVCCCEDFTDENNMLAEFEGLALSTNPDKKIETEINDILEILKLSQNLFDENIIPYFWDMFIVDVFIGNTDRHNGNWGFLVSNGRIRFSPIYDCGSCMNPLLSDEDIKNLSESEIKNLAINVYSCLKEDNKKINYFEYIGSHKNKECDEALHRIFNKINMDSINNFIDEIECMSLERKEFYKKLLQIRYNILKSSVN